MPFNNDWKILQSSADIETRVEPIYGTANEESSEEVQIIIGWDRRYRQVSSYQRMETFYDVSFFFPSVEAPVTGESKRISDDFRITQKEINGGEHTETYQTIGAWESF